MARDLRGRRARRCVRRRLELDVGGSRSSGTPRAATSRSGPRAARRHPVRLVVSQAGVADLRAAALAELDGGDGRPPGRGGVHGRHCRIEVPDYALASPIEMLPLGPSVHQLVVHGDADDRVPFQQGVDYVAAARAAGDSAELAAFTGMGHFELIDPAHESWLRTVAELTARLGA